MVRFKKMRPRRGSLAVSIIWGSPIAASSRSAAFAYRIGSPRHDSRYSDIDMSVSLRASNDRAKALNRESLYIDPAPHMVCCTAGSASFLPRRRSAACTRPANQQQYMKPLDTRPTSWGNAILVLDDPTWPKSHMIPTICHHLATSGPLLPFGAAHELMFC